MEHGAPAADGPSPGVAGSDATSSGIASDGAAPQSGLSSDASPVADADATMLAAGSTAYAPRFVEEGRTLASLGLNDAEMASFWRIDAATLAAWQSAHPAFAASLQAGRDAADAAVERRLFERATGYTHPAQKIMQHGGQPVVVDYVERHPPDLASMIFWLKNRRPGRWRDKLDAKAEGKGGDEAASEAGDLADRLDRAWQRRHATARDGGDPR